MCKECDYIEEVELILANYKIGNLGNADALIQLKELLEKYPEHEIVGKMY